MKKTTTEKPVDVKRPIPVRDYSDEEIRSFNNFYKWIFEYAPRVMEMKEVFTVEQYFYLLKFMDLELITGYLLKMQNYAPLLDKCTCPYLTLITWVRRDEGINIPWMATKGIDK